MKTVIITLFAACGLLAQVYPNQVATDKNLYVATAGAIATLGSNATPSTTTFITSSSTSITANELLVIDSEVVQTCLAPGGQILVGISSCPNLDGRGLGGTAATSHSTGAIFRDLIVATHHNVLRLEIEAIENTLGPNLSHIPGAVYPVAGLALSTGSAWGASLSIPSGLIRGLTASTWTQAVAGTDYPGLGTANTFTGGGLQDLSAMMLKPPLRTVSTLPVAASSNNYTFLVTDGTGTSDCTMGGGSTRVWCGSNGTLWSAIGGSGGGGINYQGSPVVSAIVTSYDSLHIQTPNSNATLDTSGNARFTTVTATGTGGIIGIDLTEGPAPLPPTSSGVDRLYPDSSSHTLKCIMLGGVPCLLSGGGGSGVPPLFGTAVLGVSAVSANSCASLITVAQSGISTNSAIAFSGNTDITLISGYGYGGTAGLIISAFPTEANANFKACNPTGSPITPAALTLNWNTPQAVVMPVDSPGQGSYGTAQNVTLSDVTAGSLICYTLDGTIPVGSNGSCPHGIAYSSGFTIASTTTVKLVGTEAGYVTSSLRTSIYTISAGSISYDNSADLGASSSSSFNTAPYTVSGNTVYFGATYVGTDHHLAISYNGVAMTQLGSVYDTIFSETYELWVLASAPTGSHAFTVNWDGGENIFMVAASYAGAGTTQPDGGLISTGSFMSGSYDLPFSVTTSVSGSWLVSLMGGGNMGNGTGTIRASNAAAPGHLYISDQGPYTPGSNSLSLTSLFNGGGTYGSVLVGLRQ